MLQIPRITGTYVCLPRLYMHYNFNGNEHNFNRNYYNNIEYDFFSNHDFNHVSNI